MADIVGAIIGVCCNADCFSKCFECLGSCLKDASCAIFSCCAQMDSRCWSDLCSSCCSCDCSSITNCLCFCKNCDPSSITNCLCSCCKIFDTSMCMQLNNHCLTCCECYQHINGCSLWYDDCCKNIGRCCFHCFFGMRCIFPNMMLNTIGINVNSGAVKKHKQSGHVKQEHEYATNVHAFGVQNSFVIPVENVNSNRNFENPERENVETGKVKEENFEGESIKEEKGESEYRDEIYQNDEHHVPMVGMYVDGVDEKEKITKNHQRA